MLQKLVCSYWCSWACGVISKSGHSVVVFALPLACRQAGVLSFPHLYFWKSLLFLDGIFFNNSLISYWLVWRCSTSYFPKYYTIFPFKIFRLREGLIDLQIIFYWQLHGLITHFLETIVLLLWPKAANQSYSIVWRSASERQWETITQIFHGGK